MDWVLIVTQFLNGFQLGMLLFLLAAGLTLVLGIMDLVNLAHGSLFMIGAFFCATLTEWTGSFVLAVALAVPATFVVGIVVEVIALRTLYERNHLDHVLATFGLILLFDTLVQLLWGPDGEALLLPAFLDGNVTLFADIVVPTIRILIILVGLGLAAGLYILVAKTRMGMLIRAGASNRTMISALGVDIKLLYTMVFGLGAAMAGLAGLLMTATTTQTTIGMGNDILIQILVVIVIGGIGSIRGAFVAAIIVGLIDTMGRSFLDDLLQWFLAGILPKAYVIEAEQYAETAAPALSAMLIYILMAAILFFRPQGLFPPKTQ